jgi:predicted aspartyl protease
LTLTNLFLNRTLRICALVDTGATWLIVTPATARELGFDLAEIRRLSVTVADDRRIPVPVIGPIRIDIQLEAGGEPDRRCTLEAVVLGQQECLLGQIPLEAMDLIVDPKRQRVIGRHPEGAIFRA